MLVLAAITHRRLAAVIPHLPPEPQRGRPWSCSLAQRILITCAALRTNLTVRELAASFAISKSAAHRIISTMTPRLAALAAQSRPTDRRQSWVIDGTLIPTRDHRRAARSKNYRWSCNAQVLIRRRDLRIVATTAGGPGNRNDPVHYRGSNIEALCQQHGRVLADGGYRRIPELVTPTFRGNRILRDRAWRRHRRRRARVEHAIARLKNWRILRDHRRRGCHLADTLQAVAFLHNLHLAELRDKL
ncbi:MAG TPA: transposase family protein [Kofleriaceae bacterium]